MSLESLFPMRKEKIILGAKFRISDLEKQKETIQKEREKEKMSKGFFRSSLLSDELFVKIRIKESQITRFELILNAAQNTKGDIVLLSAADADIFN